MTCDFKNIENSKEFNSMQALGANELLFIMRIINASNKPLCPEQIVAKVHLNLTIIRFYAKRLYEEGLVEIAINKKDGRHYYMRKGLANGLKQINANGHRTSAAARSIEAPT